MSRADEAADKLRGAYDRVKEFPEFNPNERVHWLALRKRVEEMLDALGK